MKKGWLGFMERRVKERLVGASILVVLIVLVVPELLSGPKRKPPASPPPLSTEASVPEPVRNVTVDLATRRTTEASDASDGVASGAAPDSAPDVSRAPPEAPPTSAAPTVTTLQAQPSAGVVTPDVVTPGVATPGVATPGVATPDTGPSHSKPAPMHHGWSVQLGSFSNRSNAEQLAQKRRAHGDGVVVSASGSGAAARYRVRLGPYPDRAAALQSVAKLKTQGLAGSLVPP